MLLCYVSSFLSLCTAVALEPSYHCDTQSQSCSRQFGLKEPYMCYVGEKKDCKADRDCRKYREKPCQSYTNDKNFVFCESLKDCHECADFQRDCSEYEPHPGKKFLVCLVQFAKSCPKCGCKDFKWMNQVNKKLKAKTGKKKEADGSGSGKTIALIVLGGAVVFALVVFAVELTRMALKKHRLKSLKEQGLVIDEPPPHHNNSSAGTSSLISTPSRDTMLGKTFSTNFEMSDWPSVRMPSTKE